MKIKTLSIAVLLFILFLIGVETLAVPAIIKGQSLNTKTSSASTKLPSIELNEYNVVFYDDQVNLLTVDRAISALIAKRSASKLDTTIYLVIDSGGGDLGAGSAMIQVLGRFPNTKLICYYCASMAGGIFEASGLPRLVTSSSEILMHEARMWTSATFTVLNLMDFKVTSDNFNEIFWPKLKITKDQYDALIKDKELIYRGGELLTHGLADQLVTVNCSPYIKMFNHPICNK